MDTTHPGETAAAAAESTDAVGVTHMTTPLTGGVEKHGTTSPALGSGTAENSVVDPLSPDNARLQSQSASVANSPAFRLAVEKLAAKVNLTAEDYRSLGIGILGYVSERSIFESSATITALYPGCPAQDAGIRVGDREIGTEGDTQTDVHGLKMFKCGLAGKPVTLIIKRHGQELHISLVRMNIEDIPNPGLRRGYERMVKRMGAKLAKAYPQLDPKLLGQ